MAENGTELFNAVAAFVPDDVKLDSGATGRRHSINQKTKGSRGGGGEGRGESVGSGLALLSDAHKERKKVLWQSSQNQLISEKPKLISDQHTAISQMEAKMAKLKREYRELITRQLPIDLLIEEKRLA